MQVEKAITVKKLDTDNIDKIQTLYENFKSRACKDYKFELEPLAFQDFKSAVLDNILEGFVLFEDLEPKGFLIFIFEYNKAVELNIIHLIDNENIINRRLALTKALMEEYKGRSDWTVISYPMLGIQSTFIRDITSLGFKMVGQAVVRFVFTDYVSTHVFKNLKLPKLPQGYSIVSWQDKYFEQASQVIHETFKTASDANFDPRFLSLEGSKEIVQKIVANIFGVFLPEATSLLLYNGNVEGVCFANLTNSSIANVPLVGVKDSHKGKGFGKYLLRNTVYQTINQVINGKIFAREINATVETNNFAAFRMYRRIGFREDSTYPHAYFKNPEYNN